MVYVYHGHCPVTDHLLPPNATPQERALSLTTGRIEALPAPLRDLWRSETCPAVLLPWLAWALSVDDWSADWPEEIQRAVIAASIAVHRKKGTPWSIRAALQAMGYRDVVLVEWWMQENRHDGRHDHDGRILRNSVTMHWAEYWIVLNVAAIDDANLRRIIDRANNLAPARCHLVRVYRYFLRHDGQIRRDGRYKHDGGIAWQT